MEEHLVRHQTETGTSGYVSLSIDGNKNMVKPLYWSGWIPAVPFRAVSKEQFTI